MRVLLFALGAGLPAVVLALVLLLTGGLSSTYCPSKTLLGHPRALWGIQEAAKLLYGPVQRINVSQWFFQIVRATQVQLYREGKLAKLLNVSIQASLTGFVIIIKIIMIT